MSSAFIRGLWGVPRSDGDNEIKTRHTIISEINNWMSDNKFITFYTYVFGIDNKSYLESVGIDNIILLDKEPEIWDNFTEMWRHKIEIIRRSLDDFDEVVWLDWDCLPVKDLPIRFWERFAHDRPFKACLKKHRHPHCKWRIDFEQQRYLPSAGFVYLRGVDIADHLIECWEYLKYNEKLRPSFRNSPTDEDAMGKLTDDILGGWKGDVEYCVNFEPFCCVTRRCACCTNSVSFMKDIIFRHES